MACALTMYLNFLDSNDRKKSFVKMPLTQFTGER